MRPFAVVAAVAALSLQRGLPAQKSESRSPSASSTPNLDQNSEAPLLREKRWEAVLNSHKGANREDKTRMYLKFGTNGVEISDPKFYDDALLSQQLELDRSRLAALNAFDQSQLKVGAISGASQATDNLAISVQGPSLPGVQSTTAAGAILPTITQTSAAASPPTISVPSAASLSASGYSVSSSSILNEQLQLQEEIADLSLLLEGAKSDQYIQASNGVYPRVRATIGVPIMINTPREYKNAIAVVEVAVESLCSERGSTRGKALSTLAACIGANASGTSESQRPTVLAVLPREKTYNVAAITDKNVNIGGGMVASVVGVSGGFLHSRKTYFLVKDQDTVAGTYVTDTPDATGVWWLFRPVLGQDTISPGPRHLVVQIGFPYPADPLRPTSEPLGRIYVNSYWRKFDRKTGAIGPEIPGSYVSYQLHTDVPDLSTVTSLIRVNRTELLADGTAFINASGSFSPGSYVRVGSKSYRDSTTGLQMQNHGLALNLSLSEAAAARTFLVNRDGSEEEIAIGTCSQAPTAQFTAHHADDSTIDVSVAFSKAPLIQANYAGAPPVRYVLLVGTKAYGTLSHPEDGGTLNFKVPVSEFTPQSKLTLRPLLVANSPGPAGAHCDLSTTYDALGVPPMSLKAAYIGGEGQSLKYLVQNEELSCAKLLYPVTATLSDEAGGPGCVPGVVGARKRNNFYIISVDKNSIGTTDGMLL